MIKDITNPTIEEIKSLIDWKKRQIVQYENLYKIGAKPAGIISRLEGDISYLQSRLHKNGINQDQMSINPQEQII